MAVVREVARVRPILDVWEWVLQAWDQGLVELSLAVVVAVVDSSMNTPLFHNKTAK
jgi:hypothetical protein